MSWAEVKKINSDLSTPLDELIGAKTDAPDAEGSLHGKANDIKDYMSKFIGHNNIVASNTIRLAADTERLISSNFAIKEVKMAVEGVVRVSVEARVIDFGGVTMKICVNDTQVGDLIYTMSSSYTTFTRDVEVKPKDVVTVHALTYSGNGYCRNFRIYYDFADITAASVVVQD